MVRSLLLTLIVNSVLADASPTDPLHPISLVPRPVKVERVQGKFTLDEKTRIVVERESAVLNDVAGFLAEELRQSTGLPFPVVTDGDVRGLKNAILLSVTLAGKPTGAEGYEFKATPDFVSIAAATPAGVFYGIQTMFQLLPKEFAYGSVIFGVAWAIPCVSIEDSPRFTWRGMHLDVGRHFASKQFVKKYIDLISRYKFNIFHWHLTDDQGWRIGIKKYPKLNGVGAWRKETRGDGQPYGGYYTQDDIREVVAFARERFITVVPEIEMPGHSMAAIASYPELSCTGGPFEVATDWGVFEDVYCAGNEKTFEFLQDVLTEVIPLFPGTFFHIGGDECPKTRWKSCPKCQARMKAEGLATEHELQSYFIRRVGKFLNANGKRLIGWDEILEGGLAPNATVMSWRGIDGGIAAAQSGHDVVMTPTSHCYFDYYQGLTGEPAANGGYLPLEIVYAYEPVPSVLTANEARHILGAQGNVWTESMPDTRMVEYMAFPRACALSEVVWSTPGVRDFQDFCARMTGQYDRLTAMDINYRLPAPTGFEGAKSLFKDTTIVPRTIVPNAVVRYTTDGSEPSEASPVLGSPIPVHASMMLRARTFLPGGRKSPVATGYISVVDSNVNGVDYSIFKNNPADVKEGERPAPVASGHSLEVGLDGLTLAEDTMTVRFSGFLTVENEGVYTFTLSASGRAALLIDTFPVAADTTSKWGKSSVGRIRLRPGDHVLSLVCFKTTRHPRLDLQVEGPGLERQRIPAAMLRRK